MSYDSLNNPASKDFFEREERMRRELISEIKSLITELEVQSPQSLDKICKCVEQAKLRREKQTPH